METLSRFIISRRGLILFVLGGVTLFFSWQTSGLRMNQNPEELVFRHDPEYPALKTFYARFGYDEILVGAYSADDVLDNRSLEAVRGITLALEQLEGVAWVRSIANTQDVEAGDGGLKMIPLLPDRVETEADREAVRERIRANPLYSGLLLSADSRSALFDITLENGLTNPEREEVLKNIEELFSRLGRDGKYYLAGAPLGRSALFTCTRNDARNLLPVGALLFVLSMYLLFRSVLFTLLPLAMVGVGVVWTLGLMYFTGHQLDFLSVLIPTYLFVLGTADCIHIFSHYRHSCLTQCGRRQALLETVRHMLLPCFLTGITTVVGFASLRASNLEPIRTFGTFSAAGIGFVYVLMLSLIPIGISLLDRGIPEETGRTEDTGSAGGYSFPVIRPASAPPQPTGSKARHKPDARSDIAPTVDAKASPVNSLTIASDPSLPRSERNSSSRLFRLLDGISGFNIRHPRGLVVFFLVIFALGAYGTAKLRVESDLAKFFGDKAKGVADTYYIEKAFGGIVPLHVVVDTHTPDGIKNPALLKEIDRLCAFLREQDGVDKVVSPSDLIRYANFRLHGNDPAYDRIPDDRRAVAELFLLTEMSGETGTLSHLLDETYSTAAVGIRYRHHELDRMAEIKNRIAGYLQTHFPREAGISAQVTGTALMVSNAMLPIMSSFRSCSLLVTALILLLMVLLFRSFWLGVLSMIPNVIPVVLTLGIMGLAGISLNVTTAPLASIALGIAVDDTIHFLARFRREFPLSRDYSESVVRTLRATGSPILMTTLILCLGFCIFLFSDFHPTRNMGVIISLTLVTAVVTDLFLMPALLILFKPLGQEAMAEAGEPERGGARPPKQLPQDF